MTPKEKAQELVDKYDQCCQDNNFYDYNTNGIKQCALIAVDEMLYWFKAHSYSNKNYDAFVFYTEVKQEIEKL